jgi:23S rRNA (uridine2552-2'-O)-methyltransferase
MTKQFIIKDRYFLEAKKQGYRARSAFKLLEVDAKFKLIKPGQTVLDIASAPGSFLQVIATGVGKSWKVFGVDIQKIDQLGYENVHLLQADIFDSPKIIAWLKDFWVTQVDLITSDIAPATTGQTGVDQYRSIELNLAILEVAEIFLKPGWNVVLKVFVGEDVQDLIEPIKEKYTKFSRTKPRACRERSFEEYFVCQGKK